MTTTLPHPFQKQLTLAASALMFMTALAIAQPLAAQTEGKGWVEGTLLDTEGRPVGSTIDYSVNVNLKIIGPTNVETSSDKSLNGFYTFRDLRPGVYEVFVMESRDRDKRHYRPQHIHGLVVKAGVRTVLNLKVREGDALEDLGTPVAPSQPAVFVPKELDRLQKEVETMKHELALLKK